MNMAMHSKPVPAHRAATLGIVLPAKNEAAALPELLDRLRAIYPKTEILLIDDGSNDATARLARAHGARIITHPYSMGNGAAIKAGARAVNGEIIVSLDADGQHRPEDIEKLLAKLDEGYDMVVGARDNASQASVGRSLANRFYNALASLLVGHRIADLTSGFRAVRAAKFREFLYLLPNGFSYPTTITMAFFRAGYSVAYVPIETGQRNGHGSHIRPLRDGARFLLIILKVATLYSPLKLFAPASVLFFLLGLGNYGYTYAVEGRFTNMSALLFSASVIVFLIGLLSEQITALMYKDGRYSDSRESH
ncbi:glycosyltransferase family 2 protein [Nitrococcus mobilis]|uniref:Glycosyltransferase involved in cell wall biogenesis n=1 Tax=Nitrococcus mobilis Nb-231 TaxID=314278 RepID=A4BNH9_9GAMM|nr:glycosyltransferase family 2 protein [Nitrococcus mobilis]EAR22778.1 Glycosyltransferase involved in cell wall biogenesis [Nitrococcus mobilis Nb-231]